jgi:hypothetical protein
MTGDDRPQVRCLIAAPLGVDHVTGQMRLTTIHLVSLETAAYFKDLGYWIVGPDPEDCHTLALWERAHR